MKVETRSGKIHSAWLSGWEDNEVTQVTTLCGRDVAIPQKGKLLAPKVPSTCGTCLRHPED